MKQELILEALSKLNPEDDSHWTQDGSPRLGAVGEGVTRQDILSVAPLFNRKNTELPSDDISEEEILAEVESQQKEFEARKQAVELELKEALDAKKASEVRLEAARLEAAKVAREEKARDTRTDTEINMDYLKSEFEQRLKRAQTQNQIFEHLKQFNFPTSGVDLTYVSPADKAIAARVIKDRRERLRNGGK